MKTKLVFWGSNEKDERLLIAMELLAEDNKVNIYTFNEGDATADFEQALMDKWREGEAIEFPASTKTIVSELALAENLLPENLKVERTDIVQRAQTEWHFNVLSAKLNQAYKSELEELSDKVTQLKEYNSEVWENLKGFWGKVQDQVKERNLFREHSDELRETSDALFDRMKELRSSMNAVFEKESTKVVQEFNEKLDQIEARIEKGTALQGVFDELRGLQNRFRNIKVTRTDRNTLWERIDKAFKDVKEKRFGPDNGNQNKDGGNSPVDRVENRLNGLLEAIEKMQRSIDRDKNELEFQNQRITTSGGQLEAQIRKAKLAIIEEKVRSKQEKLDSMIETKTQLESKLESIRLKEEEREARKEAERAAKARIKQEMKAAEADRSDIAEDLEKAAEKIAAEKAAKKGAPKVAKEEDSLIESAATMLGESLGDVMDTVKAIAEVVEDKVQAAVKEVKDALEDDDKKA